MQYRNTKGKREREETRTLIQIMVECFLNLGKEVDIKILMYKELQIEKRKNPH